MQYTGKYATWMCGPWGFRIDILKSFYRDSAATTCAGHQPDHDCCSVRDGPSSLLRRPDGYRHSPRHIEQVPTLGMCSHRVPAGAHSPHPLLAAPSCHETTQSLSYGHGMCREAPLKVLAPLQGAELAPVHATSRCRPASHNAAIT